MLLMITRAEVKGLKPGLKSVLWSGAALLLILFLAVPGLNLLSVLLLMVPYVVLFSTLSARSFLLHLVPVWVIAAIVLGPGILIVALFFLIPSVVMGQLYKRKEPASKVLKMTFVAVLALLLLELIVFEYVLDLSVFDQMRTVVRDMVSDLRSNNLLPAVWTDDYTDLMIRMMINSIPVAFMMIAFMYSVITHFIARRILNAKTYGMELPGTPEAREWKLPRSLVVFYLIVYVLDLFVSVESSSFLPIALINLMPLLRLAFAIQAVGFFFFIAHERGWHKVVPVLIAIPVLLFPPLSIIGVLDAAFPIRKSFKKT
ncbi:DUF2232 domain-containing protein [Paenibacillus gorillae]|uniref:DUF2232 domain-containing protein n=1 Tax=Paenibacillus gorillae TaxID=1243662 RepID=UPI0004AFAEA7|nr:DUF2232 domain-containing protein [Paenibacillus gorillae]